MFQLAVVFFATLLLTGRPGLAAPGTPCETVRAEPLSPAEPKKREPTRESPVEKHRPSIPGTAALTPSANEPKAVDKDLEREEPSSHGPRAEETARKPGTSPHMTIKPALMAHPQLYPFDIEVEMDGQKAVLTEGVATEEEKVRAGEIVRKLEGIVAVANQLSVSPGLRAALAKRQDESIVHYVKDRLSRSETLRAVGFEVTSPSTAWCF